MTESNDLSRPASYDADRDAAYGSRGDVEGTTGDPGYETDSTVGRESSHDADRDAAHGTRADIEEDGAAGRVAEAAADPADRHGDVFPTT